MQDRKGFCTGRPESGDENIRKYSATIGTPEFPNETPEEFRRKDRFLIWLEWMLLHELIMKRRKK